MVCIGCGAVFESHRSDARFCLPCRERREREAANKTRPSQITGRRAEVNCLVCGALFIAKRKDACYCPAHRHRREMGLPLGEGDLLVHRRQQAVCVLCGSVFPSGRRDAKYCDECYGRRRQQQKASDLLTRLDTCPECGGNKNKKAKLCRSCYYKTRTGEKNPNWKGGQTRMDKGYSLIRKPRNGSPYTLEHIAIWEDANGPLPDGWVIHHLNGVKTDNRLENLAAMPRNQHHRAPRQALVPYEDHIRSLEERIRQLEERLRALEAPTRP